MEWAVGERFKGVGTYVHLWLIHVDVWQTPTQYCKAVILHLKINKSNVPNQIEEKKRIHLLMQGTWAQSLVQEDPTCHGATKPVWSNS